MDVVIFLMILIAFLYWFIPGIAGGLMTALVIRSTDTRVSLGKAITIALGWAAGLFIGGIAGRIVDMASLFILKSMTASQIAVSLIVSLGVTGMVTALIGSWTTHRVLQSLVSSK